MTFRFFLLTHSPLEPPVRVYVPSSTCDIISFNNQGQPQSVLMRPVDQGGFIGLPHFISCWLCVLVNFSFSCTTIPWNSENKPWGLYFSKALFEGLIFGGAYLWREICVSKSIGLALKLEVNLPFLLCFTLYFRAISKYKPPRGGLIICGAI